MGYQVCDDALRSLRGVPEKYGIDLPDRQLACAPVHSPEGQHYLGAMRAAANFAWCNRQLLDVAGPRSAFESVFGRSWEDLGMHLVYDVAHNIAKFEEHEVDGSAQARLGPPQRGDARLSARPSGSARAYREIGQPVLIPGDMGRASWVLLGSRAAWSKRSAAPATVRGA